MEPNTLQNKSDEGSLRTLAQKSSDFTVNTQRIGIVIDSYPKNRRYIQLNLVQMFESLVDLYADLFMTQWSYFERVAKYLAASGTDSNGQRKNLARIYISHWMLDLYLSVRSSVEKLTPVAFTELFATDTARSSNEYDVFLAEVNSRIRPTHVVGCYEDTMFIPKFAEDLNLTNSNPWGIPDFTINYPAFGAIIRSIKDKRAGWRTARLSNETVGRPIWLFDWHSEDRVCSWFPRPGNYTNEDVMYAYLIGVACTPHLAHSDRDVWQQVPDNTNWTDFDVRTVRWTRARRYHGAYEVLTFSRRDERFTNNEEDEVVYEKGARLAQKRQRSSRKERDHGVPSAAGSSSTRMESDDREVTMKLVQLVSFLYYSRVIARINAGERLNVLLGLILDEQAHHV